jgi:antitoxin (DNA-binding transcriptional repressor) of toxin-antitoxin stability system
LLRDVQNGAEWIITERGKPIARLVPVDRGQLSLDERVRRLEENGTIEPERNDRLALPLQSGLAQRILDDDRA